MPLIYNDAIDDIPVLDRQSVFAQQRSNARANLLGESECALLQNVATSNAGVCKSRRGFHYLATLPGSGTVQGAAFFDSSTEQLVVVRGWQLQRSAHGRNNPKRDKLHRDTRLFLLGERHQQVMHA